MARLPDDYIDIHREADKFEPRLARAFMRSTKALGLLIPWRVMVEIIADADMKRLDRIMDSGIVEDTLQPSAAIVEDAVFRGNKIGAKLLVDDLEKNQR